MTPTSPTLADLLTRLEHEHAYISQFPAEHARECARTLADAMAALRAVSPPAPPPPTAYVERAEVENHRPGCRSRELEPLGQFCPEKCNCDAPPPPLPGSPPPGETARLSDLAASVLTRVSCVYDLPAADLDDLSVVLGILETLAALRSSRSPERDAPPAPQGAAEASRQAREALTVLRNAAQNKE